VVFAVLLSENAVRYGFLGFATFFYVSLRFFADFRRNLSFADGFSAFATGNRRPL
jgi:hypothetical protein